VRPELLHWRNARRPVYKIYMALSHRISPQEQVAYVTASGAVNLDSTVRALAAIVEDPSYRPHYPILADARESCPEFSISDVRALAALLTECRDKLQGRVAFVVTKGRIHTIAHMVSVFAEIAGFPLAAFIDVEEARTWLRNGSHLQPS
jgi:hypothetical protein